MKMLRGFYRIVLFILSTTVFTSCIDCRTCNLTGVDQNFDWIPYEDYQQLTFHSPDTTARYFKTGDKALNVTDKVCGNTSQDCSKTMVQSIFETDSLFQPANFVGEIYVFASESDSFTAVVNFMDYQIYQLNPDSTMENGSGGEIVYHDSLSLGSTTYNSVYEALFDTLETSPETQLVRLFYHVDKGILRFDTKDGHHWVAN